MLVADDEEPMVLAVLDSKQSGSLPTSAPNVRLRSTSSEREFAQLIAEASAIVFWEFRGSFLRNSWSNSAKLDWVHVAGAGVDDILFPELIRSDVRLTNSGEVLASPVAEYAITLVAAMCKLIPETIGYQAKKEWSHRRSGLLAGARLLVVGRGGIGRTVARLGRGLGMVTIGIGATRRPGDGAFDEIHALPDLPDQIAVANHVVLALPLTRDTQGLFDQRIFRAFRGASLVNVSRGLIIDEGALLSAIDTGRISAVALDVFQTEPLPQGHPFWSHPKVLVSPHMAGDVPGVHEALVADWLDNLDRWIQGEPLANVIDKELGYRPPATNQREDPE